MHNLFSYNYLQNCKKYNWKIEHNEQFLQENLRNFGNSVKLDTKNVSWSNSQLKCTTQNIFQKQFKRNLRIFFWLVLTIHCYWNIHLRIKRLLYQQFHQFKKLSERLFICLTYVPCTASNLFSLHSQKGLYHNTYIHSLSIFCIISTLIDIILNY